MKVMEGIYESYGGYLRKLWNISMKVMKDIYETCGGNL